VRSRALSDIEPRLVCGAGKRRSPHSLQRSQLISERSRRQAICGNGRITRVPANSFFGVPVKSRFAATNYVDNCRISGAPYPWMGGGLHMDIVERWFFVAAATSLLVSRECQVPGQICGNRPPTDAPGAGGFVAPRSRTRPQIRDCLVRAPQCFWYVIGAAAFWRAQFIPKWRT
jgi:hypothetical protein